jgi:hypothetical protein
VTKEAASKKSAKDCAAWVTSNKVSGSAVFATLLAGSLAASLVISLAFRYCTNGEKLRRSRDEMIAHMLGVRLYRDQVAVALSCYARMAGAAVRHLLFIVPALAVLALPMFWLYREIAGRLDYVPPARGEAILLNAHMRSGTALDAVRLELPAFVRVTAPPVRVPQLNEITWRLEPDACGAFDIAVAAGASRATRRMYVCDSLQSLTTGERLPADGVIKSLTFDYAERRLVLAGHEFDWELLFFGAAAVFALAFKPLTGAQF